MEQQTQIKASEFRQLQQDVEFLKDMLLSWKPYPDPEGELSNWAKKELEEARKIPDSDLLSSEEVKQMILGK